MILTHLVLFGFFTGASASDAPVITTQSSLSLINIASLSSGTSLGTEELDAIYVGKGQRT